MIEVLSRIRVPVAPVLPDEVARKADLDGGAAQTPWESDIDADGHALDNVSALNPSGDSVSVGFTGAQFALDVAGDINCSGQLRINGSPFTAGAQTPWTTNINGGGYNLTNVGTVELNQLIVNNRLNGAALQVDGDINISGRFLVNGDPLKLEDGPPAVDVSTSAPVNPPEGKLWFDQVNLRLLMWYANQWLEITSFTPVGPGTSIWDGGVTLWDGGDSAWDVGLMKNAPGEVWDATMRRK